MNEDDPERDQGEREGERERERDDQRPNRYATYVPVRNAISIWSKSPSDRGIAILLICEIIKFYDLEVITRSVIVPTDAVRYSLCGPLIQIQDAIPVAKPSPFLAVSSARELCRQSPDQEGEDTISMILDRMKEVRGPSSGRRENTQASCDLSRPIHSTRSSSHGSCHARTKSP